MAAVPNLECQSIYGPQINDNMVCVAGEYNEGACEVCSKFMYSL